MTLPTTDPWPIEWGDLWLPGRAEGKKKTEGAF